MSAAINCPQYSIYSEATGNKWHSDFTSHRIQGIFYIESNQQQLLQIFKQFLSYCSIRNSFSAKRDNILIIKYEGIGPNESLLCFRKSQGYQSYQNLRQGNPRAYSTDLTVTQPLNKDPVQSCFRYLLYSRFPRGICFQLMFCYALQLYFWTAILKKSIEPFCSVSQMEAWFSSRQQRYIRLSINLSIRHDLPLRRNLLNLATLNLTYSYNALPQMSLGPISRFVNIFMPTRILDRNCLKLFDRVFIIESTSYAPRKVSFCFS